MVDNRLTYISHKWREAIRIMSGVVLSLLMLVLAAACSESEPVPAPEPVVDGTLEAGFSIVVSSPDPSSSRAQGIVGPGYDTGEGYENYISLTDDDFRFYFFDGGNVFRGALDVLSIIPEAATATSKTYYVTGRIPAAIKDMQLKLVVLANWKTYPVTPVEGETTIADLCEAEYEFTPERMRLSEVNTIPLYGVGEPETMSFDSENFARLEKPVHLLRAFAKVEICLNEDTEYPLRRVWLTRHNTRGYCAPENIFNQDDYVHWNYDLDYVPDVHIPAGCESDSELDFIADATGRSFVAYVPEYRNIARAAAEKSVIRLEFDESRYEYQEIEFKYYGQAGTPAFDILRNYWYIFTVTKTPERDEVTVQVVPYADVRLFPDFGLLIGKDFIPVYDDDGNLLCWYDRDAGKYYDKNNKSQEIPNPYLGKDPNSGLTIIRDDDGRIVYFLNEETGQYYDADMNPIENPYA